MNGPRVIVLHGSFGAPEGNWFPWLSRDLRGRGVDTITPALPVDDEQSLESWMDRFDISVGPLRESDILVGHSMGAGFIIRLLERSTVKIRGCVLASVFMALIDNEEFDRVNSTFVTGDVDWESVRQRSSYWHLFHGSTDPYVPVRLAEDVARALQLDLDVVPNGGHLNAEFGFTEFPALRDEVVNALTGSSARFRDSFDEA